MHPSRTTTATARATALLVVVAMLLQATFFALPATAQAAPADGPAPAPASRAPAVWTYMVYMSGDNNLEDDLILNFNQMETVGSGGGLDIVVQFDRSTEYDTTNGDWNDTRRFLVVRDSDPALITSPPIMNLSEVDMGRPESLRDFIVWAIGNFTADRYYLDLAGHGGGWRDGTCNDFESSSSLDMGELKRALREAQAITGVVIDDVGFDQCLMAQLEVYYEVKSAGEVLVGAEDLIPSEGYNYTRVMEALRADLAMDAAGLGSVIVSTFFDEYGHGNERAQSAVDAEALDAALAPAVTQLAQSLAAVALSMHDQLKLARDYTRAFYYTDYIDLGNLTERLLQFLPANATAQRAAAVEVRRAVNATVLANDHGTGREGSEGISIYFPEFSVPFSYDRISMSKEQGWAAFLDAYFDRVDRPNQVPSLDVDAPYNNSVVGRTVKLYGGVSDADGKVVAAEWKLDREDWVPIMVANDRLSGEASTDGVRPGLHRLSLRARDDSGAYTRETHLTVNVEDRGLTAQVAPATLRTFAGNAVTTRLNVSTFGATGGLVGLECSRPTGWSVSLPFLQRDMAAGASTLGDVTITPPAGPLGGVHKLSLRAYMTDAPLIQAFADVEVNVTFPWPDLVVGPPMLTPADPRDGEVATVKAFVENRGLAASGAFDLELRYEPLGDRAGCYTVLASMRVPPLALGSGVELSAQWNATLGRHLFTAVADPSRELDDLVREDNTASLELLLVGYEVRVVVDPAERSTVAGSEERFSVLFRNAGNLRDIIELRAEAPTGWVVRWNDTNFVVGPKENGYATMYVRAPTWATGGTGTVIIVRAVSLNDPSRSAEFNVTLRVPEEFAVDAEVDTASGVVPWPNGTVSFNITVHNQGNGWENYTLEYVRQTDHLLVSAVDDTLALAPGCATTVEVFVSSLTTPVGDWDFQLSFTVRSVDDRTVYDVVAYRVKVARSFRAEAKLDAVLRPVLPGATLGVNLTVIYKGNYCTTLVLELLGPSELFGLGPPVGALSVDDVAPGAAVRHALSLPVLSDVRPGEYMVELWAHEEGSPGNGTRLDASVLVLPLHDLSLRVVDADLATLVVGVVWHANLSLANHGNVVEHLVLEVMGEGLLNVELDPVVVDLAPGFVFVRVTVYINGTAEGYEDGVYMIQVVAWDMEDGVTAAAQVRLNITVDLEEAGDGDGDGGRDGWMSPWVLGLLVLIVVVAVAALLLLRRGRDKGREKPE